MLSRALTRPKVCSAWVRNHRLGTNPGLILRPRLQYGGEGGEIIFHALPISRYLGHASPPHAKDGDSCSMNTFVALFISIAVS